MRERPYGVDTVVIKEFGVIMDEPTSALDAIAEQRIYEQFGEIITERKGLRVVLYI